MLELIIDVLTGLALITAFGVLALRNVSTAVTTLALQGAAVSLLVIATAYYHENQEPYLWIVVLILFVLKAIILPGLLLRVNKRVGRQVEVKPIIAVPTSLLIAAGLTMIAHLAIQPLANLEDSHTVGALPVGFAVVLIGFLVAATRRNAVNQVIGFLLIDNGIALVAILATGGLPAIVDLGALLDVALAAFVLQVLASRLARNDGALNTDRLTELRD